MEVRLLHGGWEGGGVVRRSGVALEYWRIVYFMCGMMVVE